MSVLVTGANGYLGREVVAWLLNNTAELVIGVDRVWGEGAMAHDRFKKVQFDLHDLLSGREVPVLPDASTLIHLAAHVQVAQGMDDATEQMLQTNSLLLLPLIGWVRERGISKFVFSSSMTVYADQPFGGAIAEDAPQVPKSFYGLSKQYAEQILRLACDGKGFSGIAVRLPGLYGGVRRSGLLYRLASCIRDGKSISLDLSGLGRG